jgi:mono/diheme cytochrome c family protein
MLRVLLLLALLLALPGVSGAADAADAFKSNVMPVLSAHCIGCHGGEKPKGKLDLSAPRTLEQLRTDSKHWFRVLEQIESGAMPPEGKKPLSPAERQAVAGWVRGELTDLQANQQLLEGRSKFRRLTRSEYANTIHDLFGFRPPVIRDLPGDGRVDGYDKVSTALPLSSANAAGYLKITEDILSRMLVPLPKQQDRTYRLFAGPSEQSAGHILALNDGTMVSFNTDTTSGPLRPKIVDGKPVSGFGTRVPGIHKLRLSVYAYQTDKPLTFGIYAGHTVAYPQLLDLVKVLEAPPGKPAILETEVYLRTRLDNDLAPVSDSFRLIPFGLGVQVPKNTLASNCKGPGLAVQWVDVEEPELPLLGDRWLSADIPEKLLAKIRLGAPLSVFPKGTREEFLTAMRTTFLRIGPRFYRRDLTEAELARSVENIAKQVDAAVPLRTAFLDEVAAAMTSPDFLCVIEQPGKLSGFALASRLSYFLWNSTPDETLLEVARKGQLADPKVLREQTERMLKDPKSQRFTNGFVDQWLGLRMIDDTTPDKDLYPEYDDVLKISSAMETQAGFQRMLDKNLSVRDFVAPSWALVNERLATHYGFKGVTGFPLQEVKIPVDSPFGGVWTQAATMKVTANGTLTSPVKRGVWIAERLLGTPIPPPPPNIEPVDPDTRGAKTLRQQLALHSSQGSCKACHAKFDPYGFALESFDVTGAFRTKYREVDPDFAKLAPNERKSRSRWREGLPVDSTGITPDGAAFADVRELRAMLAKNPEQLARGVTRHLLTYSTGALATHLDQRAIDAIAKNAAPEDYGLRSLIHGVVQSDVFRSK